LPGAHETLPARPWREILNDEQKVKLAEVKTQLRLAAEAVRLGILGGLAEGLCQ
jgi:hypothetical protein